MSKIKIMTMAKMLPMTSQFALESKRKKVYYLERKIISVWYLKLQMFLLCSWYKYGT